MKIIPYYYNKYRMTAELLSGHSGTLLDVGARDAVLKKYLSPENMYSYTSADAAPGCDIQINLEEPIPLSPHSFDAVVALDVLEHIEHIHRAFITLAGLTRRHLVIGLPCMASLPRRLSFMAAGQLGTNKYQLTGKHPGDRHRWLTVYPEIMEFYDSMGQQSGLKLEVIAAEMVSSLFWRPAWPLVRLGWARALFTERLIAVYSRP